MEHGPKTSVGGRDVSCWKTVSVYDQVMSGELRAISRARSALKTYNFYKMEEINTTSIDPFLWRKSTNKKMAKNVDISNEF